ncbi:MAG: hypothetical protein NT036_06350, partial [Candidatus Omnitrophica bacterium]|nr:hypothetical protein [Candidatus Omnitrophota bacterium]
MKISKYAAHMMKNMISLFIAWAFLFNTSIISAVGQPDNSSLSPQLSTTRQDSREKLSIAAGLITHAALNAHIRGEIEKIIKVRGKEYVEKLVDMGQPIPIPDMVKITGCFGHVGLGQRYGKTVIYMDRDVSADPKDREDVMNHDNYESMEWEYIRRVLNIEPGNMRAWIVENIDTVVPGLADTKYKGKTVREIALMIHKDAPSIDHLYEKYGVKIDVDIQHLIELLSRWDKVSIDDVLIVAGRPSPGLHGKREIIIGAMLGDKYKVLLRELRQILNNDNVDFNRLSQFLTTCDYAASTQSRYPVESRYPLLRAVALMEKAEQDRLIGILNDHPDIRALPIVDSILFMLDKSVPVNWAKQHAPYLIGRRVWQVAAEIWNPAGGLGRVMQFHGLEMSRICKAVGIGYAQVEPYYDYGKNREGQYVKTDWAEMLCVNPNDIKLLGEFPVMVGSQPAEAFSSEVITGAGIPEFLVGGRKLGQTNHYYTSGLYRYRNYFE